MVVDRDKASALGVTPEQVEDALYSAYGQRQISPIYTADDEYWVIMQVQSRFQSDPNMLSELYIRSSSGPLVPLSAVSKFTTSVGPLTVNHSGQLPSVTISFDLAPGVALGQAVDAITKATSEMRMPASVSGTFQGTAQAFQASLRTEPYLILAALVVVYIILGMLYESYIHPLTILSTLPSAGVGALLMLMGFHFELSVIALIGIILLIGIVKKNGIMMVDFALQAEREQHLSPEQSIRQACLLRFRPIMMTTMATLLSALALALGQGTGSELRQPLGYTMVGGLLLSQALTLFTTPVIYLYLDRLNERLRRWRRGASSGLEMSA